MLLSEAEADTGRPSPHWYKDAATVGAAAVGVLALAAALVTWAGRGAVLRWALRSGLALELAGSLHDFERQLDAVPRWALAATALALLHGVLGWVLHRALPEAAPAANPPPPRPALLEVGLVSAAVIGGLALRLFDFTRNFGYDEFFTAIHFVDVPSTWDTVSRYFYFNNHIGYSLLARAAFLAFGGAEWALRLPALLIGLGGIAATWWFGRRWIGPPAAVVAAGVLALLPGHVWYSRSARGYTGLALFAVVATHAYLRQRSRGPLPGPWSFIAAHVAGIYVHLYLAWVTVVQALDFALATIASMITRRPVFRADAWRQLWWAFPAVVILSALTYVPVTGELIGRLTAMPPAPVLAGLPRQVLADQLGAVPDWQSFLVLALAFVGLVAITRHNRATGAYLAALVAVPFLAVWLVLRPETLFPRFFLFLAPFLAWLIGAGAVAIWRSQGPSALTWVLRGALVAMLGLTARSWYGLAFVIESVPQYREVTAQMTQGLTPGTRVCAFGGDSHGMQYFTTHPVEVLDTRAQLDELLASNTPFRCVYLDVPWNPDEQQAMAVRLGQHARVTAFVGLTLFEGPRP